MREVWRQLSDYTSEIGIRFVATEATVDRELD